MKRAHSPERPERRLKVFTAPSFLGLPVRAQRITNINKPAVWFGFLGNEFVAAKGPCNMMQAWNQMITDEIRIKLGQPSLDMRVIQGFLVTRAACDYNIEKHVTLPPTLIEPELTVAQIVTHWDVSMLENDDLARQIFEGLAFRKVVGGNDACPRNYAVYKGIVYSLDDESDKGPYPLMWKSVQHSKRYEEALDRVWDKVHATLMQWTTKIDPEHKDTPKCFFENLTKLLDRKNWLFAKPKKNK